jgi:hypothetical protein
LIVKKTFLEISSVKVVVKKRVCCYLEMIEVGREKVRAFGFWTMACGLVMMSLTMVSN